MVVEAKFVVYGQAEHLVGVASPYFARIGEEGVEVKSSGGVTLNVKVGNGCFVWVRPNAPLQLPEAGGGQFGLEAVG